MDVKPLTAESLIAQNIEICAILKQEITEHSEPAIWIDNQLITICGKYEYNSSVKGNFKKIQTLSKTDFLRNLMQLENSDAENRWWGANAPAKELLAKEIAARDEKERLRQEEISKQELARKKVEERWRLYKEAVENIQLPKSKKTKLSVPFGDNMTGEIFGLEIGAWFIDKRGKHYIYPYQVTHIKSKLKYGKGFSTQAAARTFIKALIHANTWVDFTTNQEFIDNKNEFEKTKEVFAAWGVEYNREVPSYFVDIGEIPDSIKI